VTDTHLTDEQVAAQVQAGQAEFFGILVERYEAKLRRYARKFLFGQEDVDDLLQEVFLKAYINIQSFDTGRQFSPWLYRIAHNEFVNTLRERVRKPLDFLDLEVVLPQLRAKEKADDLAQREDIKQMLDRALSQISGKYREALLLYYYEDLNYQSIAEVLHLPISTVGVRLTRGRAELKKIIKQIDQDYDRN